MIASAKIETREHTTIDVYLGFTIRHCGDHAYIAIPSGWNRIAPVVLEAASLPLIRKRIWGWWHRLLD